MMINIQIDETLEIADTLAELYPAILERGRSTALQQAGADANARHDRFVRRRSSPGP